VLGFAKCEAKTWDFFFSHSGVNPSIEVSTTFTGEIFPSASTSINWADDHA